MYEKIFDLIERKIGDLSKSQFEDVNYMESFIEGLADEVTAIAEGEGKNEKQTDLSNTAMIFMHAAISKSGMGFAESMASESFKLAKAFVKEKEKMEGYGKR